MNDLSVAEKKRIIGDLESAYHGTTLPHSTARRMEANLMARVEKSSHRSGVSVRVPLFVGAAAVLAGAVFLFMLNPDSQENAPSMLAAVTAQVRGTVRDGAGNVLTSDMNVQQGEMLQTGADSELTIALGRHKIEMAENSGLSLAQLKSDQLIFRVKQGSSRFSVSKLKPSESLQVRSGNVTVHVVGTQFTVSNDGQCVTVAVSKGRVKAVFEMASDFVSKGQRRQYCERSRESQTGKDQKKATRTLQRTATNASLSTFKADEKTAIQKSDMVGGAANDTDIKCDDPVPVPGFSKNQVENSDEVLLFDNAHKALTRGALSTASTLFREYLRTYPRGLFAEDAAFRLVRIAFRQKDDAGVMRWGNDFLKRYGSASGHRSAEVRILKARNLINQHEVASALNVLAPLTQNLSHQTPRHRHQITALQLTVACDSGTSVACEKWANRYLALWPDGPFAKKAKRALKK